MDKNIKKYYSALLKDVKAFFENKYKKNAPTDEQMESDLARYINKFLENQERWRVVNNITRQINSTMDITSLYRIIIEQLLTILDIDFCAICTLDENTKEFVLNHLEDNEIGDCLNYLEKFIDGLNLSFDHKTLEAAAAVNIFSNNLAKNYSSVPLVNHNKFLGSIFVYNKKEPINTENIRVLTLVAENIASSIMNANLYSLLEQRDKNKLEFIAGMTHDLKNPLNSIIGFTALLKESSFEDKELAMNYLNRVTMSTTYMSNLIAGIMDMARAESGKIELDYEIFSPKIVILEILSTQEKEFNSKKLKLNTSFNDTFINADARRFREVVDNLVSNASKYSNSGGLIEITTYCSDEKFYFEIKDNGEGISRENQGKLFKFFSQASDSKARRDDGHGVGLAVCKNIVDMHKGLIDFESERGVGTTFRVVLPVNTPSEKPADACK